MQSKCASIREKLSSGLANNKSADQTVHHLCYSHIEKVSYLHLLQAKFHFLASLYS